MFVDMPKWIHQFVNDHPLSTCSFELAASVTPAIFRALQACLSFLFPTSDLAVSYNLSSCSQRFLDCSRPLFWHGEVTWSDSPSVGLFLLTTEPSSLPLAELSSKLTIIAPTQHSLSHALLSSLGLTYINQNRFKHCLITP